MKSSGYIHHQGTYTLQSGNEKGAGFLPFTGIKLLLILGFFLASVLPCTALQITFKQNAQVARPTTTLGDIAAFDEQSELSLALATQKISQSPPPGESVILKSGSIKHSLISTLDLPGSIVWNGSPTVTLKRNGIQIGTTRIQNIIAEFLALNSANLPDAEIRFIPSALPLPFILPAGKLSYEVIPSNPGIIESSRFSIIFRVNNKVAKNMSVKGRIEALAPVVVVARKLKKGAILSPDNLTLAVKDLREVRNPGFDITKFTGKRLTRHLRAGTPITPTMISSPPVIKKGQRVKILISSGTMQLSATGIARNNGQRNQMIRVQNINSNKIIHCRVKAPGLVEVLL